MRQPRRDPKPGVDLQAYSVVLLRAQDGVGSQSSGGVFFGFTHLPLRAQVDLVPQAICHACAWLQKRFHKRFSSLATRMMDRRMFITPSGGECQTKRPQKLLGCCSQIPGHSAWDMGWQNMVVQKGDASLSPFVSFFVGFFIGVERPCRVPVLPCVCGGQEHLPPHHQGAAAWPAK